MVTSSSYVQEQGQGTIGTVGTTSTSTITSTILDSDQSLSVSREEEGVRSAISTEEESEVTRHLASPEAPRTKEDAKVARSRSAGKRMSLAEVPAKKQRAPLRTAMSVQVSGVRQELVARGGGGVKENVMRYFTAKCFTEYVILKRV